MANPSDDGVLVREAITQDARALLALKGALDRETSFMLLEPDERATTETKAAEQLRAVAARSNSVVLVADSGGELVGYVEAIGGGVRRNQHTAHVVIGVRQLHAGQGIGRRLLAELESWARANGVLRLELTVMTHNERAVGPLPQDGVSRRRNETGGASSRERVGRRALDGEAPHVSSGLAWASVRECPLSGRR
jgi:GNAT superfamily N-acetyltransferase